MHKKQLFYINLCFAA